MFCKYDFKNYKQLPKNQMPKKMRCRQKREEGQTKYRHSRQIVRLVWTAAENKQKGWGKKERKKGWSFLSGSERSDIYGWIGCSQSQARMTAENGAGLTWDDFARISTPINGRLVSVCIAPLSVCIYIAITAISFIASSRKWKQAFRLRALFLSI